MNFEIISKSFEILDFLWACLFLPLRLRCQCQEGGVGSGRRANNTAISGSRLQASAAAGAAASTTASTAGEKTPQPRPNLNGGPRTSIPMTKATNRRSRQNLPLPSPRLRRTNRRAPRRLLRAAGHLVQDLRPGGRDHGCPPELHVPGQD